MPFTAQEATASCSRLVRVRRQVQSSVVYMFNRSDVFVQSASDDSRQHIGRSAAEARKKKRRRRSGSSQKAGF